MREYDTPSEVMKNIIRYTTNSNQDRYQIDAERCYDGLLMSQLKRNKELLA